MQPPTTVTATPKPASIKSFTVYLESAPAPPFVLPPVSKLGRCLPTAAPQACEILYGEAKRVFILTIMRGTPDRLVQQDCLWLLLRSEWEAELCPGLVHITGSAAFMGEGLELHQAISARPWPVFPSQPHPLQRDAIQFAQVPKCRLHLFYQLCSSAQAHAERCSFSSTSRLGISNSLTAQGFPTLWLSLDSSLIFIT